jgi:hypothetical protein
MLGSEAKQRVAFVQMRVQRQIRRLDTNDERPPANGRAALGAASSAVARAIEATVLFYGG